MESEIFTPMLEQFLLTPLVAWVKAAGHSSGSDGTKLSEYIELVDGIYLNEIMLEINPKAIVQRTNKKVNNDSTLRIQNLSILIRQIKSYYQETLQQLVAMPLPNVLVLGRNPLSEQGLEEMRKLLLLLLGCAVQVSPTAVYTENVLSPSWAFTSLHPWSNCYGVVSFQTIVELTQERDCGQYSPPPLFPQSPNDSPSMRRTESRQHLSVELADAKAKIRRLLCVKTNILYVCGTDIKCLVCPLQSLQLLSDARSARAYRDELDVLREKAIRVDKLESEVGRYKERLHDIEFYKARVEELKEDNQVLLETKAMLEDQLEGTRARSDKLHELEKECLQLKSKIHDMEMERDMDRKRIEELLEENLVLEMAQKQSMDESLHLGWQLEQLSKTPDLTEVPQKSLGHEVNELTSSRLLKLEKENQALLKTVEELRSSASEDAPARRLKADKENQRLTQRVRALESELNTGRESLCSAESLSTDLMKEKALLEKTLETLRENSDRQVKGLEQENEHLTKTVSSLRQRSQVGTEARVKDVEKENRVLHESIRETSSKLNKLEFERKQLRKDLETYKEKGERAEELEVEAQRLERENEALQKRVASLVITCDKVVSLEKENSELEAEGRRLKKEVDSLRSTSFQLEALEKENSQLDEENLELRRTAEVLRSAGNKAAQLELENLELESERSQLKRSLELLKASSKKTERLEVSNQGLDTENQRLQKALDNSSRKMQQLEGELQDVEQENQSLQRSLEELKISSKRLEQLEQENKTLEQESSQLEKDKKQLEKDNKRLRQQAEIRDSKMDEDNLRISHLEKDNRSLGKEMTSFKDSCNRLKDLEKENKELVKQATIDKKTLVNLREELVSEKLRTQQINNDLEKLTHELEKIGLNKERLLQDEQSSDDDRYKLLEFKLESTLKSTLEIKEEKIAALEARLQESSNLNQQLRQELRTVSPKQYRTACEGPLYIFNACVNIVCVCHFQNATLQAEKQALHTNLKQLETQSSNLQAQILALQRQTASLQENNTTLQTQNAKLQVENSTLNSQSGTLMAQNAQLATQQSSTENEKEGAVREREDLRSTYEMLLRDHEKLAALHERQALEYEGLIGKHGGLKSAHKSLESQHRDLEDRYNQLLRQKDQLEELEKQLKAEQEKMLFENKSHEAMAIDYYKLKEENERLNMAHGQLVKDNEGLQVDHKNLKSQMNSAKLEQTRLEAEFSKLKEQYQQLDITSTKLTNQCELLSQLKGNLEEENRHLLDQIQTLMLQNRTLLEQTMESKDLYHIEQRQYIDKLNELRRQKEKLEEKIMDQYKFYDPSPPRSRGNWITLKMKKLIKPRSLERMRSLTLTPTLSESSEGFLGLPLDSQDSSSIGSGSNSLDDTLTQNRSSTVKWLPFMRTRSKEKDKAKDIYRRSMSMNDLLQTIALAGGQWAGSTENLEGPLEANGGNSSRHMKKLGSMAYSTNAINYATLTLPSGNRDKRSLKFKGTDYRTARQSPPFFSSRASSLHSIKTISSNTSHSAPLEAKGTLNGNLSRPHSESSGEFSLGLDQEDWSSGSSPVQQPLSRSSHQSPMLLWRSLDPQAIQAKKKNGSASEVLSLQQFLEDLSSQSKAVSERLDISSSTLPRASSVISTAEGSTRRTSIHDLLSKDTRQPVSVDPSPSSKALPQNVLKIVESCVFVALRPCM
uniref:Coiled-coil domain containing 88A n=1 Tax=Hucho hucho TaxID=62062 RepID=A0A4W5LS99_9TELE